MIPADIDVSKRTLLVLFNGTIGQEEGVAAGVAAVSS